MYYEFLFVGFIVLIFGTTNFLKLSKKGKWKKTTGKITQSTAEVEEGSIYLIGSKRGGINKIKTRSYKPKLRYTYKVGDEEYESSTVFSAAILPTTMDDILMLTDGSEQTVYFNPEEPSQSYLIRSSLFPTVLVLFFGTVITIYGFIPSTIKSLLENYGAL